jgi:Fibronectin type III domain
MRSAASERDAMTIRSCSGSRIPGTVRALLTAMALGTGIAACGQITQTPGTVTADGIPLAPGTATLDWTPVTQNTDGTLATELAGYQVYYGSSPDAMNSVVIGTDPSQTRYVVTNLTSGTWYFAVAAYTSAGTTGLLSNIGSKTID